MNSVFLDTSALIAIANRRDHWHQRAEATWKEFLADGRPLVTTNVVLIEVGDGLSRLSQRAIAVGIRDVLQQTAEIVELTRDIEHAAWELFENRSDKEWGLTDCVSMTVMTQRSINEVFTLDHHFRQAGYRTLP